ncbi:MAG TPA: SPOR domain-containing protein [Burkholderiales bacterium]|nr:SPOR domain-containing protein [Burkholderiales bacterium]
MRERPASAPPPHEPAQALIAPPEAPAPAVTMPPPPPPQVANDETLPPRPEAQPPATPAPAAATRSGGAKPYMVQIGVFSSAANAQALQRQLKRAGMDAHLETRVQLGPFKDREQAEKALAHARKLGVNAVLVPPR